MNKLNLDFSKKENEKIQDVLLKLNKHLKKGEYCIVGSIAIRHYLSQSKIKYKKRPLGDIDVVINTDSTVQKSITDDFLIGHYHPQHGFFAIVDPIEQIKVDLFGMKYGYQISKILEKDLNGNRYKIVSLEDQLTKSMLDLKNIRDKSNVVDSNLLAEVKAMLKIANLIECEKYWIKNNLNDKFGSTLQETFKQVYEETLEDNSLLGIKPKPPKDIEICESCTVTKDFPLVSPKELYQMIAKPTK